MGLDALACIININIKTNVIINKPRQSHATMVQDSDRTTSRSRENDRICNERRN